MRICMTALSSHELFWKKHKKLKNKSVPLQAWTGPEGSRNLRFPDFVTTAQDGGRLSALLTGRLYPQEILLVLISVRCWVDPRTIVRSEGFYVMEGPLTPAVIESATFRVVAQNLCHCASAVPLWKHMEETNTVYYKPKACCRGVSVAQQNVA